MNRNYTCPCCGYKTLDEEPPDTFDICEICFWEDDGVQFQDPDFEGGANVISLRQAQQNFVKYGACDKESLKFVRSPNKFDIKDSQWKPL
jgi:Cysteine-rich CPCC